MVSDMVATSWGPLGIEQPFVGFDEWPITAGSVFDAEVRACRYNRMERLPLPEFEVLAGTTLYDLFTLKYGGLTGARIWAESTREFAGWKVTRLEYRCSW